MKFKNKYGLPGFTLIELLVVIAILGVLMGMVIVVINPASIRTRANQGVGRANVARACDALLGCMAVTNDTTYCDSWTEIGVNALTTPATATIGTGGISMTVESCVFSCTPTGGMQAPSGTACQVK